MKKIALLITFISALAIGKVQAQTAPAPQFHDYLCRTQYDSVDFTKENIKLYFNEVNSFRVKSLDNLKESFQIYTLVSLSHKQGARSYEETFQIMNSNFHGYRKLIYTEHAGLKQADNGAAYSKSFQLVTDTGETMIYYAF